jgi:hypothetical protein
LAAFRFWQNRRPSFGKAVVPRLNQMKLKSTRSKLKQKAGTSMCGKKSFENGKMD